MLYSQSEFSNYEIFKILHDQLTATMNIIPYENTNLDNYGIFDCLEILHGLELCSYILEQPSYLKKELND